jgi:hypothetical protein
MKPLSNSEIQYVKIKKIRKKVCFCKKKAFVSNNLSSLEPKAKNGKKVIFIVIEFKLLSSKPTFRFFRFQGNFKTQTYQNLKPCQK